MSILVPIGGGPDGMYALKKAVEHGQGVYTMSMALSSSLDGAERHWKLSRSAVAAALEYFKDDIIEHYDFATDVPFSRADNRLRGVEYFYLPALANLVLRHDDITAIATGVCREEFENAEDITQNRHFLYDAEVIGGAFKALLDGRDIDRFFGVLPAPDKQQCRDYIGEFLWALSYVGSCGPNSPKGLGEDDAECGKCYKCLIRNATEYRGTSAEYRVVKLA